MRITSWGLLDLAPDGVYKHSELHQNLVVSYTTISPLPQNMFEAVYFLLHFPSPQSAGSFR